MLTQWKLRRKNKKGLKIQALVNPPNQEVAKPDMDKLTLAVVKVIIYKFFN